MGKPLTFRYGGHELPFVMEKVDRAKLYGYIDLEAIDDDGRPCELATLCADGRTIVARGGRAIAYLSQEGSWLDRAKLVPVDSEGRRVQPVPSTFAAPVPLDEARKTSVEDYLVHNIKGVYSLSLDGDTDAGALLDELRAGAIYTFPYSFRGGIGADVAFLLAGSDGTPFLAIGQKTTIHYVGLDQLGVAIDDEGPPDEAEDEDLDFGMM